MCNLQRAHVELVDQKCKQIEINVKNLQIYSLQIPYLPLHIRAHKRNERLIQSDVIPVKYEIFLISVIVHFLFYLHVFPYISLHSPKVQIRGRVLIKAIHYVCVILISVCHRVERRAAGSFCLLHLLLHRLFNASSSAPVNQAVFSIILSSMCSEFPYVGQRMV